MVQKNILIFFFIKSIKNQNTLDDDVTHLVDKIELCHLLKIV